MIAFVVVGVEYIDPNARLPFRTRGYAYKYHQKFRAKARTRAAFPLRKRSTIERASGPVFGPAKFTNR